MTSDLWNLHNAGDYAGCLELAAKSLVASGGIDHLHIAGLALMNLKRQEEGLALLNAAVTMRPNAPHIYSNAAYISERYGLIEQLDYFASLGLRDFPDNVELLLCKANSLVMQMRFDEANEVYRLVLERDPTQVQPMINLGNLCRMKDDFTQAARWFDRAEAAIPPGDALLCHRIVDPNQPAVESSFARDLIFARATMYTQMGEEDKAITTLEDISDDIDAKFLLSLLYMGKGDYLRGFDLYRDRGYAVWARQGRNITLGEPFDHLTEAKDKKIAVVNEGGLGDLIMFARYIPALAEVAKSVTLFIPKTLRRLFRGLGDNVHLAISADAYHPSLFDYTTSIVDMPWHFRTTIDTIPSQLPYLSVPSEVIEQHRLPPTDRKRIGLCWAGGTRDSLNARPYDTRRSVDLAMYAPFGKIPGIEFVSLQLGQRAEQERLDLPLTRVLNESFDMLDTAAIIAQLDLVISVDTSVPHLAAAIGKPVWLLSRYDCCWRWLKNRSDAPWYPGMIRVYGQHRYNDWSRPVREVTEALREFVRG